MEGTAPVVEANECWENEMAGIGCRDLASPVLRNNLCRHNKMAGIGCRGAASPVILGNECRENEMAGIGLEEGVTATIQENRCIDNRLVAIGVTGRSHANILGNRLSRTDGVPPILAVKEESTALIRDNEIRGGGVAAVLVQGTATLLGNRFQGVGPKQGNAIWVWQQSDALIADNRFDGYRTAVTAKDARLVISGNRIRGFQGAAISIQSGSQSVHVMGNRASSPDPKASLLESAGRVAVEADNELELESVEGGK
jgi:nitrous oxidase accessory protein NosD